MKMLGLSQTLRNKVGKEYFLYVAAAMNTTILYFLSLLFLLSSWYHRTVLSPTLSSSPPFCLVISFYLPTLSSSLAPSQIPCRPCHPFLPREKINPLNIPTRKQPLLDPWESTFFFPRTRDDWPRRFIPASPNDEISNPHVSKPS